MRTSHRCSRLAVTRPAQLNLTVEHQQKLNLMVAHVANNMKINEPRFLNPALLNKFLLAKGYNVEKAIKLFEEYWRWRHQERIDMLIVDDFTRFEQFKALYPRQWYFNDKMGRPLLIEQIGKANFKEIFKVAGLDLDFRHEIP